MNKRVSTGFAILVILIAAVFSVFMFWHKDKNLVSDYDAFEGVKKEESNKKCSRHAYDGEAKIRVWSENKNGERILNVVKDDLGKLPVQNEEELRVKLVDGSSSVLNQIKNASEKKPVEVTVRGFYSNCEDVPMVSLGSGEEVFKKYLN